MLRTRNDQPTLWESVLPEELRRLPAELARVDVLLDDERFFAPFRAYFHLTFGRPSIPIEVYLRLMFLKVRYRLGYESLCAEVADSIGWRQFTRIGIDGRVPQPIDGVAVIGVEHAGLVRLDRRVVMLPPRS